MNYKNLLNLISFILILLILAGCAGTSKCSTPTWYHDTPSYQGYIYSMSTATDTDINIAVDKAKIDATNILKSRLKVDINVLVQKATYELDLESNNYIIEQFADLIEQVFSKNLHGIKIDKRFVCVDKINKDKDGTNVENYRAYILIRYDELFTLDILLNKINENELLHKTLGPTLLYEDLKRKVKTFQQKN